MTAIRQQLEQAILRGHWGVCVIGPLDMRPILGGIEDKEPALGGGLQPAPERDLAELTFLSRLNSFLSIGEGGML